MDLSITIIALVSMIGFYVMIAIIVTSMSRAKQRRAELLADVQNKLIDRFGSSTELAQFLGSDEGRRLMTGMEQAPKAATGNRILAGVRRSIVLSFVGAAFLLLCIPRDTRSGFLLICGGILFALGAGYFVATLVSVRLSREWGLVEGQARKEPARDGA
jgi:ABC-type multidrug transport system fused ATPase/permease subunit